MSGDRNNPLVAFGWRSDDQCPSPAVALEWLGTVVGSVWSKDEGGSETLGLPHISQGCLAKSTKRTMASWSCAAEQPVANQAKGVKCEGSPCN